MIKRLSQFGNSRALIIDKPLRKILSIEDDTELKLVTDGKTLTIIPIFKKKPTAKKKSVLNKKLKDASRKVLKQYGPVFKKLAKN